MQIALRPRDADNHTEPTTTADAPAQASAVAGGTWTTKAPLPTPRGELAAAGQNNSLGQPVLFAIAAYIPDWSGLFGPLVHGRPDSIGGRLSGLEVRATVRVHFHRS